jgi:hypothetical protein
MQDLRLEGRTPSELGYALNMCNPQRKKRSPKNLRISSLCQTYDYSRLWRQETKIILTQVW